MAKQGGTSGIAILGGIGILGLGLYFAAKYATIPFVETPYVARLRAYIASWRSSGQDIFFTIRIENPNTDSLIIKSIVGDVYINDLHVGNVAHFGNDIVRGNAQSSIELEVTLKVVSVVQNLLNVTANFLTNQSTPQILTFVGTANINGSPVDIKQSITLA